MTEQRQKKSAIFLHSHGWFSQAQSHILCMYIMQALNILCNCINVYGYIFLVPVPFVQITLDDMTIGDPLTLDCTVTAVRGISSSVDIVWTTGGREFRRADNITADIDNDDAIYTDLFEISSLSAIDNGTEYQCTVVINANQPVYSSDEITLIFSGE